MLYAHDCYRCSAIDFENYLGYLHVKSAFTNLWAQKLTHFTSRMYTIAPLILGVHAGGCFFIQVDDAIDLMNLCVSSWSALFGDVAPLPATATFSSLHHTRIRAVCSSAAPAAGHGPWSA